MRQSGLSRSRTLSGGVSRNEGLHLALGDGRRIALKFPSTKWSFFDLPPICTTEIAELFASPVPSSAVPSDAERIHRQDALISYTAWQDETKLMGKGRNCQVSEQRYSSTSTAFSAV